MVGKRVLTGALLVDDHAVTTVFSGAVKVASAPGYSLYRPAGQPRLALFFLARYDDGWMGDKRDDQPLAEAGQRSPRGHPRHRPRVAASARSDDGQVPPPATVVDVRVAVPADGSTTVRLPVCSQGPWVTGVRSKMRGFVGRPPRQREGRRPSLRPRPLRLLGCA